MKTIILIMATSMLTFFTNVYCQRFQGISSISLTASTNKTSNLIFPFAIRSVDIGSKDLLAQKANGIENILQIKAARENFDETNLSVVTSDGKFYSFLVDYSANPTLLNINFENTSSIESSSSFALFNASQHNDEKVAFAAKTILYRKRFLHGVKDRSSGVKFLLNGIYIDSDILYFQLEVDNKTNINYDFESLNFFTKDLKQDKRTAVQEIQQTPIMIYNDSEFVNGKTNLSFVVALQKFTIPDKKELVIQLMEKNGGRKLSLKIRNRTLVKARTFSLCN